MKKKNEVSQKESTTGYCTFCGGMQPIILPPPEEATEEAYKEMLKGMNEKELRVEIRRLQRKHRQLKAALAQLGDPLPPEPSGEEWEAIQLSCLCTRVKLARIALMDAIEYLR